MGPEAMATALATGVLVATAVWLKHLEKTLKEELKMAKGEGLERIKELEELSDRLNEELGKVQYESMKAIQRTRNDAIKFFGKANEVIEEARKRLSELEKAVEESKKELDWETSITKERINELNEEINATKIELSKIREEIGRIHLALLDFDKRIKDIEKNTIEAERIALNVLDRIEEVLENETERPAEGDREDT